IRTASSSDSSNFGSFYIRPPARGGRTCTTRSQVGYPALSESVFPYPELLVTLHERQEGGRCACACRVGTGPPLAGADTRALPCRGRISSTVLSTWLKRRITKAARSPTAPANVCEIVEKV